MDYTDVFIMDTNKNSYISSRIVKHIFYHEKKVFYLGRTSIIYDEINNFLCGQNKSSQILPNVMYIGVHNQDKPLPPGTLQR